MIKAKKDKTEKKINKKRRFFGTTLTLLVVTLIFAGLSRAWFANESDIATLVEVSGPTQLSLRGAHGKSQTALDMNYTDDDVKNGKVTIRRVVSVCTDNDRHRLEIAHTTNLKGLEFKIYPATENESESTGGKLVENGYSYSYDTSSALGGSYINQKQNSSAEYKEANDNKHSVNFEEYKNVQAHAEPLYWLASGQLAGKTNVKNENDYINTNIKKKYVNYYVIEVSWTETQKETDIFYVMAKDA